MGALVNVLVTVVHLGTAQGPIEQTGYDSFPSKAACIQQLQWEEQNKTAAVAGKTLVYVPSCRLYTADEAAKLQPIVPGPVEVAEMKSDIVALKKQEAAGFWYLVDHAAFTMNGASYDTTYILKGTAQDCERALDATSRLLSSNPNLEYRFARGTNLVVQDTADCEEFSRHDMEYVLGAAMTLYGNASLDNDVMDLIVPH